MLQIITYMVHTQGDCTYTQKRKLHRQILHTQIQRYHTHYIQAPSTHMHHTETSHIKTTPGPDTQIHTLYTHINTTHRNYTETTHTHYKVIYTTHKPDKHSHHGTLSHILY